MWHDVGVLQVSHHYDTSVSSSSLIMGLTNFSEVLGQNVIFSWSCLQHLQNKWRSVLRYSLNYYVFNFHLIFRLNFFLSAHPCDLVGNLVNLLKKEITTKFPFNSQKTVYKLLIFNWKLWIRLRTSRNPTISDVELIQIMRDSGRCFWNTQHSIWTIWIHIKNIPLKPT